MRAGRGGVAFAAACGLVAVLIAGCSSAPPAASTPEPVVAVEPAAPGVAAFEQRQRDQALAAERDGRLADAALAWEVLTVLRPDSGDHRDHLDQVRRQADAKLADRLQRAAAAARRGDNDTATQHYLAALALQPLNAQAADALRALERDRNKRQFLGRPARLTTTRRALADAEMQPARVPPAASNELEHASMLAGEGELDAAIALLERRLAANLRDTAVRRLLASVCLRKAESLLPADRAGAFAAVQRSASLDPDVARAQQLLKQLKAAP